MDISAPAARKSLFSKVELPFFTAVNSALFERCSCPAPGAIRRIERAGGRDLSTRRAAPRNCDLGQRRERSCISEISLERRRFVRRGIEI